MKGRKRQKNKVSTEGARQRDKDREGEGEGEGEGGGCDGGERRREEGEKGRGDRHTNEHGQQDEREERKSERGREGVKDRAPSLSRNTHRITPARGAPGRRVRVAGAGGARGAACHLIVCACAPARGEQGGEHVLHLFWEMV
jgi:hypothetical protein